MSSPSRFGWGHPTGRIFPGWTFPRIRTSPAPWCSAPAWDWKLHIGACGAGPRTSIGGVAAGWRFGWTMRAWEIPRARGPIPAWSRSGSTVSVKPSNTSVTSAWRGWLWWVCVLAPHWPPPNSRAAEKWTTSCSGTRARPARPFCANSAPYGPSCAVRPLNGGFWKRIRSGARETRVKSGRSKRRERCSPLRPCWNWSHWQLLQPTGVLPGGN